MPLETKYKVKYTYNQFMACYTILFHFISKVFIFKTIFAYDVYNKKNINDHLYDIDFKG